MQRPSAITYVGPFALVVHFTAAAVPMAFADGEIVGQLSTSGYGATEPVHSNPVVEIAFPEVAV